MGRWRRFLWLAPALPVAAVLALLLGMAVVAGLPPPGGPAPPAPVPPAPALAVWDLQVAPPGPGQDPEAWGHQVAAALAAREVELQVAGQTWRRRLDELGYHLDQAALRTDLVAGLSWLRGGGQAGPGSGPGAPALVRPQLHLDADRFQAALAPLVSSLEQPASPAALTLTGSGEVQIVAGTPGWRLDPGQVQAALRGALSEGISGLDLAEAPAWWTPGTGPVPPLRVAVALSPVAPSPSAEELAALGVQGLIAEYRTYYDPEIPRGENVARAARALDGLLIRPGEVFSYNRTIGPVDAAAGWQPAWVIAGGRLVPGVGGGVCQTATTLYGAALRAGLEVLERHPHDLPVGYIEPSQDAAVAPGAQDLKLRNPGPGAVWIQTRAQGGEVVIAIYGSLRPGREVRIESEVLDRLPPPVKVVADPALPPGTEAVREAGAPGVRSAGYRLVYERGRLISRELLSVDVYAPTPRVLARGGEGAGE